VSALIPAPIIPYMIDPQLILTRHRNIVCVMKSESTHNVLLGSARLARSIANDSVYQ